MPREEPKRPLYRNFKSFNNEYFEEELSSKLDDNNKDYASFEDNFVNVLNKHAPKNTKFFRGNHKPPVFKTLKLAIMKRSRLKNKANKTQLPGDKQNYKKQRNLVTTLNKEFKKGYFENIEDNIDSKNIWNKCKPHFSDKYNNGDSKSLLNENEEIINESTKVPNVFNSYFESVTETLDFFYWAPEPYDQAKDSVESIIQRFSHHPGIIKIKQNINISKKFSFTPVTADTVKNIINGLPKNKSVSGNIPLNFLRSGEFTFSYLTECINEVQNNSKFPESLKLSDIVPV